MDLPGVKADIKAAKKSCQLFYVQAVGLRSGSDEALIKLH